MKKIAIVTGASSGMGREFVKQISHYYPSIQEIWVIARRQERLEQLAAQVDTKLRIFAMDLTKKRKRDEIKETLEAEKPDVKILVNAAGFGKIGYVDELDEWVQGAMIGLNCYALTILTQMCIPYMHKKSRIINLASTAAFLPQPGFDVYAASKAYVLSFSRGLRHELKNRGIYVTAVCPGPVDTEFFEQACTVRGMESAFKKKFMVQAKDVVHLALKDAAKNKEMSVYSMAMKVARLGAKIIPHKWLIPWMEKLF